MKRTTTYKSKKIDEDLPKELLILDEIAEFDVNHPFVSLFDQEDKTIYSEKTQKLITPFYQCKFCNKTVSIGGRNSDCCLYNLESDIQTCHLSLYKHLESLSDFQKLFKNRKERLKHKEEKTKELMDKTNVIENYSRIDPSGFSKFSKNSIDLDFSFLILERTECLSFRISQKPTFLNFLSINGVKRVIDDINSLSKKYLEILFDVVQEENKEILRCTTGNEIRYYSIDTYSKKSYAIFNINCFSLNINNSLITIPIGVESINENIVHNASYIYEKMKLCIINFEGNFDNSIERVVTRDCGSNGVKATDFCGFVGLDCCCRRLQLVQKNLLSIKSMSPLSTLVDKLENIKTFLLKKQNRIVLQSSLKEYKEKNPTATVDTTKMKKNNDTRWEYVYQTYNYIFLNYKIIEKLFSDKLILLDGNEKSKLFYYQIIFSAIFNTTKQLENSNYSFYSFNTLFNCEKQLKC